MNASEIILALEEQTACYRRLFRLTELQHLHVQQQQTEPLLKVLLSRQALLDQVGDLERAVRPAKRDWSGFLQQLDVSQRDGAEKLLNETRSLLEQITRSDENDALVLQQRKLKLGKQIQQASAARSINRNYAAAAYGTRSSRMDVQQ